MPLTNASSPSMHDRLLVVAVERVLARVGLAVDARAAREGAHGLAHLRAAGMKGGDRRPGPHEDAHVDAFGELGEQRARGDRRLAADELEVRGQVPAGQVHEVAGALHRLGDGRQRLGAVDEHVERAALAWRRVAGGPYPVVGRLQCALPPQAPESAAVLGGHGGLDRVAQGGVGTAEEGDGHRRWSSPERWVLSLWSLAALRGAKQHHRGEGVGPGAGARGRPQANSALRGRPAPRPPLTPFPR